MKGASDLNPSEFYLYLPDFLASSCITDSHPDVHTKVLPQLCLQQHRGYVSSFDTDPPMAFRDKCHLYTHIWAIWYRSQLLSLLALE